MTRKMLFKFTVLALFINVNNSIAQVSYKSDAERENDAAKRSALKASSPFKKIAFRNIGPSVMSGRVVDLSVNPSRTTEFLVAYATGGLWYTNNNGQSLKPIFQHENNIGLGAVAADWQKGIIWVGTGEANSSRSSYAGDGIYRSTDTGRTWKYMGLPSSGHISKIVLNPGNTDEIWVAVLGNLYSASQERGVYHSLDGGESWKRSLFVDNNTGAVDLSVNPGNTKEVYATMWYRTRRAWNFEEGGASSAVYKTSDAGMNWTKISTPASGLPTGANIGRIGIAVAASHPSTLYLVADNQNHRPDTARKKISKNYTVKDFQNISKEKLLGLDTNRLDSFLRDNSFDRKYTAKVVKQMVKDDLIESSALFDYLFDANTALFETPVIGAEIYKSSDAGNYWKKVNTKPLNLYNTYGYYFGNITVAADDTNKIVIGGYDLEQSIDAGKTFTVKDKPSTHADWHVCWIDPADNKHWIAGNDGGVNVTYDEGKHWFKANTPSVGQFYNIAVDNEKPYNVYGGLQDNGTWYGPSTTKDTDQWDYESSYPWEQIGGGDGMQVQVDTIGKKYSYYGSQFGYYNRKKVGESRRGFPVYPRADLGKKLYRYNWQTPILISHYNPDIFYYGANFLLRSFDNAEHFDIISPDLTKGKREGDVPYGTTTSIAESPLEYGLLYVGTDDGNIQRTTDAGKTWSLISNSLPANKYISRITASKFDTAVVYAALNGYRDDDFSAQVYRSSDRGNTWKAIATALPLGAVNVLIEDEKYADIIYIGTDNGLYVSFDKGQTVVAMSDSLPTVPIHDLVIQKRENDLVVGTHGRSIYIASLKEIHAAYENRKTKK